MVGSVGSNLVQFKFNVGEVSFHVEDDVWFSCGSVWFSVGSGGLVLVLVWFSLVQVVSWLVQFYFQSWWFSSGSVLVQVCSLWVKFWFCFGLVLVLLLFRFVIMCRHSM